MSDAYWDRFKAIGGIKQFMPDNINYGAMQSQGGNVSNDVTHIAGTLTIDHNEGTATFVQNGQTILHITHLRTPVPHEYPIDMVALDNLTSYPAETESKVCDICKKEHRKADIVMIGETRLIPGHEYQLATNTPSTRYARSWRMGFIGKSAVSSTDLQFSARGPDRSTAGQYAGDQMLDKRYIVRVREVERNDTERYVAKKLTGVELY